MLHLIISPEQKAINNHAWHAENASVDCHVSFFHQQLFHVMLSNLAAEVVAVDGALLEESDEGGQISKVLTVTPAFFKYRIDDLMLLVAAHLFQRHPQCGKGIEWMEFGRVVCKTVQCGITKAILMQPLSFGRYLCGS